MTLFYYPLAFLNVASALEQMDNSLEEAARISGAGPLRVFWDITLPLVSPSFFAGGLLVFAASASAFGIPAMIGMPSRIYVLSTQVMHMSTWEPPRGCGRRPPCPSCSWSSPSSP